MIELSIKRPATIALLLPVKSGTVLLCTLTTIYYCANVHSLRGREAFNASMYAQDA